MTSPRLRLLLSTLEDRTVPSGSSVDIPPALGDPWPDAGNLTVSFAPDSAKVNDTPSVLFQSLNKVARTGDWQFEILRAFQSWAAVSNLNVGLVTDGGQAFGTPGDVQGDYRFGDIRIGARLMSMDALANAVPFEWSAGTWSGDVLFNSGVKFGINPAQAGTYDLYTVALHEAGHSFGLGHSDDPLSVLSENYTGTKAGLAASDVANIQRIYGARLPDRFEGPGGNGTWDTATQLTGAGNLNVTADLTTTGDVDYYRFLTPARADKFLVDLNTSGISLLTAKVTVYDAAGRAVGADLSTDPTNGNLEVKVDHPAGSSLYTVRVESARSDVFGVGRYSLSVVYKDTSAAKADPNDHGTNDTPAGATVLIAGSDNNGNGWAWGSNTSAYSGRLESKTDVDYYRVTAPADGGGPVMVVRVGGTENQKLPPVVEVLDANLNPVAARVVESGGSELTLQVDGVLRGHDYFVRVRGNGSDATNGNYRLRVSFTTPQGDGSDALLAGGLGGSAPTATGRLTLTSGALFQFGLQSSAVGGTGGATVTLTVTDASGKNVATTTQTAGGGLGLLTVYLPAGDYTATLRLTVPSNSTLAGVNYVLSGGVYSDPVGPYQPQTGSTPGTTGTGATTTATGTTTTGTGTTATTTTTGTTTTTRDGFIFIVVNSIPVLTLPYSF
jgi:hypothetical protein